MSVLVGSHFGSPIWRRSRPARSEPYGFVLADLGRGGRDRDSCFGGVSLGYTDGSSWFCFALGAALG
jgi:hypothetical protein